MSINKVYLDTSVISHLYALETPEKMNETLIVWNYFIANKYEIYISKVTFDEINDCKEPKQTKLLDYLSKIKYKFIKENEESLLLLNKYLELGVLNEKSKDDLRHISLAVVNKCDIILSWNFKHLVNFKTIKKIQEINELMGYKNINILSPSSLIEEDDFVFDPDIDYIHKIRYDNYEKTKNMTFQELVEKTDIGAQIIIDKLEELKKNR